MPFRTTVESRRGGGRKHRVRKDGTVSKTDIAPPVQSIILGNFDRNPRFPYCRQTAFNAKHPLLFREGILPFVQRVADTFRDAVPKRYESQTKHAEATHPAWVIPGTPFTTVTVNRNWRTMLHQDAGDLPAPDGISTIAVVRRGSYTGCWLTFPQYGVGVDMKDGDVLIFDSHEWHANTPMEKESEDALRVSIVSYYRTKMKECGSPEEELERAKNLRGGLDLEAVEESAYVDPGEPA